MSKKRIIITVGGTGGHVYPALSLAKQLYRAEPGIQILFVGGKLDNNKYFDRNTHTFQSISCGSIVSKNPFTLLKNTGLIAKGVWQSRNILKTFNPDLVVGFGSYYTFPLLIAAKLSRTPIILHEANSIPGKVNRIFAPYAETTGIHFPDTASLLKGHTVEVGMPMRDGYFQGAVALKEARQYFCLSGDKKTLLVFGGSQGANAINHGVLDAINAQNLQVVHITGDSKITKDFERRYQEKGISACVKDFENRMDLAWQAADCVISRAGAGTIAEQLEFEVPGILIPYPHAADKHQDRNADFMKYAVKGAFTLPESELNKDSLSQALDKLMHHHEEMTQAMRDYKTNKMKRQNLCSLILHTIEKKQKTSSKF